MEKPCKYFLLHKETKEYKEFFSYYEAPLTRDLCKYVDIGNGVSELKQVWDAYIDTRYEAKLRLYNYVNYTKKGLPIPRYKPFEGTEIGKSMPILNF